ncbi:hypothetical protein ACLB2K_035495 [Fragaria x ananassa]
MRGKPAELPSPNPTATRRCWKIARVSDYVSCFYHPPPPRCSIIGNIQKHDDKEEDFDSSVEEEDWKRWYCLCVIRTRGG